MSPASRKRLKIWILPFHVSNLSLTLNQKCQSNEGRDFLGKTMKARLNSSTRSASGMTLLELLAVLGVISVLIGLGTPAVNGMLRSGEIGQAAQVLTDQLALARQMALSSNRQIEVRLYKFIDPQMTAGTAASVRAIQLFEVPDSAAALATAPGGRDALGYRAVSKFTRLPGPSVIIDSGNALSTLIGSAAGGNAVPTVSSGSDLGYAIPALGTAYSVMRFSFLPDGSTNLPPQSAQIQWFFTVHDALKGDNLTAPPPNFATLQIQPSNGKVRSYRP